MLALPLSWPLENRQVVLIGEGAWLTRKLNLFARTPAQLTVFTPVEATLIEAEATVHTRWPDAGELNDAALIVVAFEDRALAEKGATLARTSRAPLNVVDYPDLSDFHFPAIIDRGPLSIGVATGGTAPVLARETRRKIEAAVPPSDTHIAEFALAISPLLREAITNVDDRRRFWEDVLQSPAAELAREGRIAEAVAAVKATQYQIERAGVVHLVGAGPGDPELLTLKALRLLSEADVIVYDRLVGAQIMDLARRDSERFYVGKARSNHSVPQEQIHDLLVEQARLGKRVVRLKGGDPFVFGRGGEEVEALRQAGIEVHVTPGITAALGCAASAGVPLTHRDHAQSVTFVTGHLKDGDHSNPLQLDWSALSAPHHTLVIYMGVATASEIAGKLMHHGRMPDTPVLIIENGTRADERRTLADLATLEAIIAANPPQGPALLIIGEVASLYAPEVAGLIETAQQVHA
ncbi:MULTISPECIES: siroheme synthase CysG [Asticcacaulis]|uniref:siroheme synthase CysG n=1 Tax=Asticcacaulis TaxID=76890 RepID=UPI001AEAC9D7|nr:MULTISPECIES: siroheme synthase CysG [Asticcacaulis]MBP2160186.1 uroporphyrin-III C-methyltransferase/precorrin-2 dehydrogenase/sirohydrochlorin ferrochelatase [Asticcacaulis solisilvae]MDR6801231.1 uroporphyrin-III C-methyltransferase/precorrin-2 dehydrogenase/sirohydrochlorin ferrochelatase [Asticcacaulis sp. BE141]